MFNDSDSFFYSPTGDLTNTLQRQFSGKYDTNEPLWKRVRRYYQQSKEIFQDVYLHFRSKINSGAGEKNHVHYSWML